MAAPPDLRWRLADDDDGDASEGGNAQGLLFQPVVERHVGKGEYRGMEFLHVNARRIINEVPAASRMPFRFTINAYRGCSHACTYCLSGDTEILLTSGRTRRLAEVAVGDEVYGTIRRGNRRRYVATRVLAHWSVTKAAYRIAFHDGTQVVASADHRFLTDDGWRFVTGSPPDMAWRSHLTAGDGVVGAGETGAAQLIADGRTVPDGARLRVVSIVPLGHEVVMFDMTTGTGDFVANGVVSHNCFARPTHEYLGMNSGDDFDRRIVVKVNAVERLRAELAPARWGRHHIAMGTNTDPYQRCEAKYRLTQGIIRELAAAANPFSILTKSTLILRDLDLLADATGKADVRANFSIGTLDEEVWRLTEPGTPHPRQRVAAVARLNQAGIRCGVLVGPVLPGLSDRPDQLEEVVKECVEAGALSISPIMLHLRPGVREHYLGWLAGARPDLASRYEQLYPRAYAPKSTQQALSRQVARMVARHGGRMAPSGTRPTAARVRPRPRAQADQLGLEV